MGTTRYGAMAERSHVKPSISSLHAYNSFFLLFFLYFQGFPTKFYYARRTKTTYWLFGKLEIENPGGDSSRRIVLQALSFLGQLRFNYKWDSIFCKLARIALGVELKMAKISCANWNGKGREKLRKSTRSFWTKFDQRLWHIWCINDSRARLSNNDYRSSTEELVIILPTEEFCIRQSVSQSSISK